MLEYLRKRQGEAKAQETEKEQTAVPAGAGNQAMLSMLEAQGERGEVQPASGGTPLAEAMRAKFERHFGLPMDDVRVHRNSDEPAKFDAGAYTYGTDIFVGPGQENLLSHEMTHVAQQKLGQVRPTGMEHGMAVNRSPALEHSADLGTVSQAAGSAAGPVVQCGGSHSRAKSEDSKKKGKRRKEPTAREVTTRTASKHSGSATTATSPQVPEPMETTTTTTTHGQYSVEVAAANQDEVLAKPKVTSAMAIEKEAAPKATAASSDRHSYKDDIEQFGRWKSQMEKYVKALSGISELKDDVLDAKLEEASVPDTERELVKKLFRAKQLFTTKNLKGASVSENGIGSIYFGGTKLEEHDDLSIDRCAPGGRLRLLHEEGPELRTYCHVKQKNIVDKKKKILSEEMKTYGNEARRHKSRGQLDQNGIDSQIMTDSAINDLMYAVAYAETMTQKAIDEKNEINKDAPDYAKRKKAWTEKYKQDFNRANSFIANYISRNFPGLYSQLNTQDISLDYYGPAPELRRYS